MMGLGGLLGRVLDRPLSLGRAAPDDRAIADLCKALLTEAGEATGLSLAKTILARYASLDDEEKRDFFMTLARDMDVNAGAVHQTIDAYDSDPTRDTYRAYAAASEPPRQELIRRLNRVPGATARLVAMRADLLRLTDLSGRLGALDQDFRHLFSSWFNRGFLVLSPIDWRSPALILEKIIAYEAVHDIAGWDDLRRRLQPADRRCYGFFHPAMPDEPLIFVEVALTRGIPGSVQRLLSDKRDPITADEADTAVFYSISNCQSGLAGISFGNSLIKQVVEDLGRDLKGLKTFVTLSPIPGFMKWLGDQDVSADLSEPDTLRRLTATYLLDAKRGQGPLDPVARFHLGNGALVHAVHAEADISEKGRKQSAGAMVNYLYDPDRLAQNHEALATHGTIASSASVRSLAGAGRRLL
ncbi:malonyl-CoA decarboxylase [Jannaschia sp. 2305UL9-9]|uniref:malonyl-CoA decarboxylase n=1 Tax=Jannaschia sp. 2305UL9-9 TaxID=3121638 RepID=UPI0035286040